MNSLLRITVEVTNASAAAAQIRTLQDTVARVGTEGGPAASKGITGFLSNVQEAAKKVTATLSDTFNKLQDMGKQGERIGRQLMTAFTLPIVAFAAVGVKALLDQQKATEDLRKAYGDLNMPVSQVKSDLTLLDKGFTVLSDTFGLNKAEIIGVAAAWAQAGATGTTLINAVQATTEAVTLGGGKLSEVSAQLIGIAQAWHLSGSQLRDTVALVNEATNQSKVPMTDYLTILQNVGAQAITSGVDQEHLVAMLAALEPAAGQGASAINGLRAMMGRFMAPTEKAVEVLNLMGINAETTGWQSKTASERIQVLADAFVKLSPAQQGIVANTVASRFQIDKFDELMRDVANSAGRYHGVLGDVADKTRNMADAQKNLNDILKSNPMALKEVYQSLLNGLAQALIPLIPVLIQVGQEVSKLIGWFAGLSPHTQQMILMFAAFLAIAPVVVFAFSAIENLVGTLGKAFIFLVTTGGRAIGFFDSVSGAQLTAAESAQFLAAQDEALAVASTQSAAEQAAAAQEAAAARTAAYTEALIAFDAGQAEQLSMVAATAEGEMAIWDAAAADQMALFEATNLASAATFEQLPIAAAAAMAEVDAITAAGMADVDATIVAGEVTAATGGLDLVPIAIAALVAIVIGLLIAFHDDIATIFKSIGEFIVDTMVKAWGALPEVVQTALMGVYDIAVTIVSKIWEVLSYLNPFARHSPSLVDNVQLGVDVIAAKYASLGDIGANFRNAVSDMQAFSAATEEVASAKYAKQREDVVKANPDAGGAFDEMVASIQRLESALPQLQSLYDHQSQVVKAWESQLDAANDALKVQEGILKDLKTAASELNDALTIATDNYNLISKIQPAGLTAAQDAIFANDQAQKRLQLEILQASDAAGMSVDEAKQKLAELAGALETAQARATNLRLQGAGSDVLGPYVEQTADLRAAQSSIQDKFGASSHIEQMQEQLKALQNQGQELNLTMAVTFDPMQRQLDKIKNQVTELPFDQLVKKLLDARAVVDSLTAQYKNANDAVKLQQTYVDEVTARRDELQKTYDVEKQNLDDIKTAYNDIKGQIDAMNQALSGAASSAKAKEPDTLTKQFNAAGDFPQPNLDQPAGLGVDPEDLKKKIDEMLAEMKRNVGSFDPFKPIKDKFNELGSWLKEHGPAILMAPFFGLGSILITIFPNLFGGIKNTVVEFGGWLKGNLGPLFEGALGPVGGIFETLGGIASTVWGGIKDAISRAWEFLKPIFELLGVVLAPVIAIFETFGVVVWTIMGMIGTVISGAWNDLIKPIFKLLWEFITNMLKPVFEMIGALVEIQFALIGLAISAAWNNVIKPVFQAIWGFINDTLGPIFMWLWDHIVSPVFDWIGGKIHDAWDFISPVFGWIWGAIENVGTKFQWLYDNIVKPVFSSIVNFVRDRINDVIDVMNGIGDAINSVGGMLHIGIHVDKIPHVGGDNFETAGGGGNFASGGIPASTVGPGFITNGPRAIVGEGNASWHEYVIPTDPMHRDNALRLLAGAEKDLGLVPKFAFGGILDWVDAVVPGASILGEIGDNIIDGLKDDLFAAAIKPAVGIANAALSPVPDPFHSFGVGAIKMILETVADIFATEHAKQAAAGNATGSGYGWQAITHYLDMMGQAYEVTSTTGGGHAEGSRHYMGDAVDLAGDMPAIAQTLMGALPALFELIHNPGFSVKQGQQVDPGFWGGSTWDEHRNHVHAASYTDPSEGPGFPTGTVGDFGPGSPREIGQRMAAARGWTGAEWDALDQIFTHESGWDAGPSSVNPSSGAYGIPQANPSGGQGHPYALGDVVGQIQWGLDYIAGRYGDPIAAWNFWQAHNWYQTGGLLEALPAFQHGGIVPGLPGTAVPIMAHAGETVTPANHSQSGRTVIFNGDLAFPNITDPADAGEFLRNLEALV